MSYYCIWATVPEYDEAVMVGQVPTAFVGTEAPDGDREYWSSSPVGELYLYKPDETTNPKVFVKRQAESRDDDWGALGGMHCVQQRIVRSDFTDGGSTVGTLVLDEQIPVGAWVFQTILENVTGFTGDTSATIQVGDGTDADRYSTSTPSVFTTANAIDVGVPSGTKIHTAAKSVTVTVTSAADFTNVAAGAATVKIFYLL